MNKRLLLLFTLTILVVVSCNNRPNTILEGNLRYAEKNVLRLEFLNINKTEIVDSLYIKKDGSFRFRIFVDQPGVFILKNEKGRIINLLISSGEKIKIDGDYNDFERTYSVMGSPDSEYIRQLVQKLSDTRNQLKILDAAYTGKTDLTESEANEYLSRRTEIIRDQRDFSISFIIEHLSSIASIYALYQKLNPEELVLNENRDIQYMKIVADTLSVKYPESSFVKSFVNDARTAERRYSNLIGIQKKIIEGSTGLPDISFPDPDGNLKSLSALKGKTVLLYFWSVFSQPTSELNHPSKKPTGNIKTKALKFLQYASIRIGITG